MLARYLGTPDVFWLGDGIVGDDTDGHIDDLTRFVDETTLVTVVEAKCAATRITRALAENRKRLDGMRLSDGRALSVVELPMPSPLIHGDRGRLPASYANFYIGNDVVVLPVFDAPQDAQAIDVLTNCFPFAPHRADRLSRAGRRPGHVALSDAAGARKLRPPRHRSDLMAKISEFIRHHYRHFNAAALIDAADGYARHIDQGGKMFMTLAGAMSTAELGLSLAEMIRRGKVHAICCTGANLEEDLFNLVAHDHYVRVPHYRELSPQAEEELLDRHLNRVTDTCIPEEEAIRRIEHVIVEEWIAADRAGEHFFPDEYMYKMLRGGLLDGSFQIDKKDSLAVRGV